MVAAEALLACLVRRVGHVQFALSHYGAIGRSHFAHTALEHSLNTIASPSKGAVGPIRSELLSTVEYLSPSDAWATAVSTVGYPPVSPRSSVVSLSEQRTVL